MQLPKVQGFSVVLVIMLIASGVGLTALYLQSHAAEKENGELVEKVAMTEALTRIEARAWHELASIDRNMTEAAIALRSAGLNGAEARGIMAELWGAVQPYGVDIVTVDDNGYIVAAYPSEYEGSEGAYIGDQAQVEVLHRTLMPVMSEVFTMVEGFEASDMEVPVFDDGSSFIGSLSVTVNIQKLVGDIVADELPARFQFTCLQPDGREIYDTDEAQIGRNLFSDPIYENYTEVLDFMRELVKTPQGHGTYEYLRSVASGEVVRKEVYWSSFGLHGAEWRLLVIRAM